MHWMTWQEARFGALGGMGGPLCATFAIAHPTEGENSMATGNLLALFGNVSIYSYRHQARGGGRPGCGFLNKLIAGERRALDKRLPVLIEHPHS